MKRTKRKPAPKVTVGENDDIDWTPASAKVFPRVVTVERGKIIVDVQEINWEPVLPNRLGFVVGAGARSAKDVRWNILGGYECTPQELDEFIELLTIARDKAKALGMPSQSRS